MPAVLPHDHRDAKPSVWPLIAAVVGYAFVGAFFVIGVLTVVFWFAASP